MSPASRKGSRSSDRGNSPPWRVVSLVMQERFSKGEVLHCLLRRNRDVSRSSLFPSLLVVSLVVLGGIAAGPAVAEDAGGRSPSECPRTAVDADANTGWVQTARVHLRIREYPTTRTRVLGYLPPCTVIAASRSQAGQRVGNTRTWYKLEGQRGWISGAYARTLRPVLTS